MALVVPCWHSTASRKSGPEGGTEVSATEEAVAVRGVKDLLETVDAKALLDAGRENGQLTADEIAVALDELDLEPAQEEPREVSTDALQLFLKDIGKVDLLTAAQEVELAKRIERGDHCAKQE